VAPLSLQKLALTPPTSGGLSVSIAHSQTQAREFFFSFGNISLLRVDCIHGITSEWGLILGIVIIGSLFVSVDCWFIAYENVDYSTMCKLKILYLCNTILLQRHYGCLKKHMVRWQWRKQVYVCSWTWPCECKWWWATAGGRCSGSCLLSINQSTIKDAVRRKNSVGWVCEWTIPTERPPLVVKF
jgi:hypothetical protein